MSEENLTNYVVRQGDCIASIAAKTGFLWTTIWEYSANSELKNLRKDPNILHPGDIVAIPPMELKEVACETEARHTFVKKDTFAKVTIRLLQEGEPRTFISYILNVYGITKRGKTDSAGYLTLEVPPKAKQGTLLILDNNEIVEEYVIKLGHLDPLKEIAGIQKRLSNLGFECEVTGELDVQTRAAINEFRAKNNLEGEEIDGKLREKLNNLHKS